MARKKKDNTPGLFLSLAGGSALLAGGYYAYNRLTKDDDDSHSSAAGNGAPGRQPAPAASGSTTSTSSSATAGGGLPKPAPELAFPLRIGDRNEYVRNLQAALIKKGGKPAEILRARGGADGIFGDATKDALYETPHFNWYYIMLVSGVLKVDRETYNKIVNTATLSGVPMPTAYAARDTFMLTPESVLKDKAYPVRAGVRLGKYKGAKDGMAEVVLGDGRSFFTKQADVELR